MKFIYLKPALKCDSFDIAIGIKIPFFRVLVTIEPGRSLLQFVTTNCLTNSHQAAKKFFSNCVVSLWMSLTQNDVMSSSVEVFKSKVDNFPYC